MGERLMIMNKRRRTIYRSALLSTIFGLLLVPATGSSESEWKLALQRDGIEVSTRAVAGSDLDEFIGSTVIEASVNVIETVIDDVPAAPQWMADCREAKIIRKIDQNSHVVLNVTKTPWPVWDRETLLVSMKQKDAKTGTVIFAFHSINDPAVPVGKKNVRIPSVDGQWILSPVDEGHTKVTYTVKSNPGGFIPNFISQRTSWNIPYKTLLGLRKMVKKDKYRGTIHLP
ncbi:MAG TPA: START domain-containing protein [Syntrophales bacterium]|nr:START domain-containing protein [Syntrophales bacterium]